MVLKTEVTSPFHNKIKFFGRDWQSEPTPKTTKGLYVYCFIDIKK